MAGYIGTKAVNLSTTGADINGSIVITGTVDGRDVSTDGTKLDGIETLADVTDTASVTAAGALMDSEVTNLAQVKAFSSTDYATAAQGTLAANALPKSGGAMTGAITTNSTFDGRDVATDGIKLDGIEALADVTGATNVTAAGALMDSEVTNLAQVKSFNSSDYATAAQGTAADAALPKSGGTMTGDIVVKGVTETNFALTGTTPAIDPTNGTIQTWTLAGASTPTFAAGWSANEGITLMIDDGSASAITWPTMQWSGGAAPTLPTTGYAIVTIWKEGSVYYGVSAGDMS